MTGKLKVRVLRDGMIEIYAQDGERAMPAPVTFEVMEAVLDFLAAYTGHTVYFPDPECPVGGVNGVYGHVGENSPAGDLHKCAAGTRAGAEMHCIGL